MVDDLAPFYQAPFGRDVTVAGVPAHGIFNTSTELTLNDALVQAPTLRLPATVAAADGDVCAVGAASYTVRQVLTLPPDGVERLLVLRAGAA